MNKKSSYSNIGYSSILLVFVTITFLSFGVLSLITANADYRLSKKTADRNKDFYLYSSQSEMFLADTDDSLSLLYNSSDSEADYFNQANQLFETLNITDYSNAFEDFTYDSTAHSFTYTIRISDLQVMRVDVQVTYPDKDNDYHFYIIENKKTYTDSKEESLFEEEPLHLLGGE